MAIRRLVNNQEGPCFKAKSEVYPPFLRPAGSTTEVHTPLALVYGLLLALVPPTVLANVNDAAISSYDNMAMQPLRLKLDTGELTEASALYLQPSPTVQKQEVTDPSGRLFKNSLTVEGGEGSSSGNYAPDSYSGMRLRHTTPFGTVVGEVMHARQFGETAATYNVDYYANPIYGYELEVDVGRSPDNTFLPRDSVRVAFLKDTGSYTAYGSVTHSIYAYSVVDVLFSGIGVQINNRLFIETGLFYAPQVNAYSFLAAPQLIEDNGNKTFAYLSAGEMGDQLPGNGGILRTPSCSLKIGQLVNISAQTTVSGDFFSEYFAGLYNRAGFEATLTRRW